MSLIITNNRMWLACLCCFLLIGCKEPALKKQDYIQEIVMEQMMFSSMVYHSPIYRLGLYEKPIFVYRYSGNMCHSCIIKNLMELRDFQERIGKERILVLPSFPEDKGSKARLNTELADFNYSNISPDSLIIPIHKTEGAKSYFAVLNSDDKLEMVFFPVSEFPAITQAYFKEVGKRLQKSDVD